LNKKEKKKKKYLACWFLTKGGWGGVRNSHKQDLNVKN